MIASHQMARKFVVLAFRPYSHTISVTIWYLCNQCAMSEHSDNVREIVNTSASCLGSLQDNTDDVTTVLPPRHCAWSPFPVNTYYYVHV